MNKNINRQSQKRMANKLMKRCSLVIREMQIKPTVRYHIIAIQLASIKDSRDQVFAKMWNNDTSE